MIKSKKQMFIVIGAFLLVLMLSTVTYAFFNYTRTGSSNIIKVGRISFNTTQGNSINLTNVFPIDVTNGIPDDNTKVGSVTINASGDTTYAEGIEYLVSAVNVQNSLGNKNLPISIEVSYTNSENEIIGTLDNNYFTNRGGNSSIYKVLANDTITENGRLVVGYIASGATGIDGNIVIKAYLDNSKIAITDTNPEEMTDTNNDGYHNGTTDTWVNGRTVFTSEEWNSLQENGVFFKVKVEANEGIWVSDNSLYNIMKEKSVMDNISSTYVTESTGIDFKQAASDTNGKGVYMLSGTENDTYPIVYYRGTVEDNNVVFADKCWKAVRTTETGGVKLVYSSEKKYVTTYEYNDPLSDTEIDYTNDATYPYTYDSEAKKWSSTNHTYYTGASFKLRVKESGNYYINYETKSGGGNEISIYLNDTNVVRDSGNNNKTFSLGAISPNDEIRIVSLRDMNGEDSVLFQMIKVHGIATTTYYCLNDIFGGIVSSNFNEKNNSIAYNGYMYGDVIESKSDRYASDVYYGTDFTYDGTMYSLVNPTTQVTQLHHYTCNLTTPEGKCEKIRYIYDEYGSIIYYYYYELSGGNGISEAINNMQVNTNDSIAKRKVDDWYQSNLVSYTSKLEDTVWCNDRSASNYGSFSPTNSKIAEFYYNTHYRVQNGTPSLNCQNKNDSFTVNNDIGNQKLDYPIGLLTVDEVMLAGRQSFAGYGWTMSPDGIYSYTNITSLDTANNYADISPKMVGKGEDTGTGSASFASIRPSISLKNGATVAYGDGTENNPYVIE